MASVQGAIIRVGGGNHGIRILLRPKQCIFIAAFSERPMKKDSRQKTDVLQGVLRGDGFECKCTAALVTRLTQTSPSVGVWTSISITSAEKTPPDGNYRLEVKGRVFPIDRADGKWETLKL